MSANTKMVLIPLDRYEELTSTKSHANQPISSLEGEQRSTKSHPKLPLSSLKGEQNSVETCEEKLREENILDFIPKDATQKVKLILRHMKTHEMTWDNCRRLVMDNDCILDANVIEIIKDVVMTEKEEIESRASKQFYKLLILTNFPVSLLKSITNVNLDKVEKDTNKSAREEN